MGLTLRISGEQEHVSHLLSISVELRRICYNYCQYPYLWYISRYMRHAAGSCDLPVGICNLSSVCFSYTGRCVGLNTA
jgi:hypothetical protein